ncbi:hypothetical protein AURDEDRAFT_166921 [Auricularia subglabra TFB-10046 SS5]|nr:hypothetical protein AURDEDRAFT_166921 [Auricularia subglabra TFB-10046 SS5]
MRRFLRLHSVHQPTTGGSSPASATSGSVPASPTALLAVDLRDAFNVQVSTHNRLFRELLEEHASGHDDRHRQFLEVLQMHDHAFGCAQERRHDEWRVLRRTLPDSDARYWDAHLHTEAVRDDISSKALSYCHERAGMCYTALSSELEALEALLCRSLTTRPSQASSRLERVSVAYDSFVAEARSALQITFSSDSTCDYEDLWPPDHFLPVRPVPDLPSAKRAADLVWLGSSTRPDPSEETSKLDVYSLVDDDPDDLDRHKTVFDTLQSSRQDIWFGFEHSYDNEISRFRNDFLERQSQLEAQFSSDPCLSGGSSSAVALSVTTVMNFCASETRRSSDMQKVWDSLLVSISEYIDGFQRRPQLDYSRCLKCLILFQQ